MRNKKKAAVDAAAREQTTTQQNVLVYPQYNKSPDTLQLLSQARRRLTAADMRGDDDAWVRHYLIYIQIWPVAFADAMEARR